MSGARLCLDLDMEGALRAESVVGGRVEDRIGLSKLWRMHGRGKIQIGCLLCYLLVYAKLKTRGNDGKLGRGKSLPGDSGNF